MRALEFSSLPAQTRRRDGVRSPTTSLLMPGGLRLELDLQPERCEDLALESEAQRFMIDFVFDGQVFAEAWTLAGTRPLAAIPCPPCDPLRQALVGAEAACLSAPDGHRPLRYPFGQVRYRRPPCDAYWVVARSEAGGAYLLRSVKSHRVRADGEGTCRRMAREE